MNKRSKFLIGALCLGLLLFGGVKTAQALYGLSYHWVGIVDENGKTITSGLTATVRVVGGDTATIYSNNMAGSMANPIVNVGSDGKVGFWYTPRLYDLVVSDTPNTYRTMKYESLSPTDHIVVFPKAFQKLANVDIDGGTIDGTVIGGTTPATVNYLSDVVNCDPDTTVLAANSGALYTNKGASTAVVYTLPTAAEGLTYLFSSVATDTTLDMTITAASGDKINGGSAAGSYAAKGTEENRACTIIAVDATDWRVINKAGTWANE